MCVSIYSNPARVGDVNAFVWTVHLRCYHPTELFISTWSCTVFSWREQNCERFFFFLYLCRYNMICVDVVVLCYHRRMLSPQSTNCLSITGMMHTITGGICLLIREVAHFRYGNSSDVLTHTYIHYTDNLISKYWILKFVCRWLQTLNVIWAKLLPQRCVMGDHSNTDPSLRI